MQDGKKSRGSVFSSQPAMQRGQIKVNLLSLIISYQGQGHHILLGSEGREQVSCEPARS